MISLRKEFGCMSDPKENKTIKTDPRYICAGASACLILIGIIVYKICESKMNIAVENLRSYYGSVDSGLFLTQQEYLLRQALLLSILIPVIVGIILLVALFVYLDRMIPASFKKSKTKETDVKVKDPRKKRPAGTNEKKTDLVELIGKVKDSYAHKMEEKMPNAALVVLEGTDHYSFLYKPVEFRNILRAFLGIGGAA